MAGTTITRSLRRVRLVNSTLRPPQLRPRRTIVPPPAANSGPLLSRRSDRELPSVASLSPWRIWRHMPVVAILLLCGGLAIFNYEKSNHSVVSSSLYALRVHPRARELLGDEIYFAHQIPWIHGTINPMHGEIDVKFSVKGTTGSGMMRFRATKGRRTEFFKTDIWQLEMAGGKIVNLLDTGAVSPMAKSDLPMEES